MALEVVAGPAFAGKGRYVRGEVDRREAAGEVGLLVVDYTALYLALAPGEQSALRDERVTESGAARLVGALQLSAIRLAVDRQLSGYVTANSPGRAAMLADMVGAPEIVEVQASVDDLARRTDAHVAGLSRSVGRAKRDTLSANCGQTIGGYLTAAHALRGRTVRPVTQRRGGRYQAGEPQTGSGYDRDRFLAGLTPAARQARERLIAAGNADPSPAEIFRATLAAAGRR